MNNDDQIEIYVELRVFSETLLSTEMEELLGISASQKWNKDEFIIYDNDVKRSSTRKAKESAVCFNSGIVSTDLNRHLTTLYQRFESKCEVLEKLVSGGAEAEMSVALYSKEEPKLRFSYEEVNMLAKMNADLDLDLYILGEHFEKSSEGVDS